MMIFARRKHKTTRLRFDPDDGFNFQSERERERKKERKKAQQNGATNERECKRYLVKTA